MYNHNKAQQSKNRVHISWDILYRDDRIDMPVIGLWSAEVTLMELFRVVVKEIHIMRYIVSTWLKMNAFNINAVELLPKILLWYFPWRLLLINCFSKEHMSYVKTYICINRMCFYIASITLSSLNKEVKSRHNACLVSNILCLCEYFTSRKISSHRGFLNVYEVNLFIAELRGTHN